MHPSLEHKVFGSIGTLAEACRKWKADGHSLVFTNGCFDLLHPGHVDYLFQAKDLGNKLIIGVNTDSSVSHLKGPHRPIQPEQARLQVLAGLACADALVLFDDPTPLALISAIGPQVLVKGGDYTAETVVGAKEVLRTGGRVVILPFLKGHSTTALERRILAAHNVQ
ncbi:MAG: D-glycero-beta-D-manno-heptose 1-phosphate adenylyltransferase [Bacteroidetes bacterium]|jgi:D-beta-D-heptose 7-phosphate kinase/D-beta-D-heptose 1-phosphate adenosyltransferase|nr:D-glycero-beta-D-manno-heptose 1-phosphate adenylyltransferase [Bacteroidota bacterium]